MAEPVEYTWTAMARLALAFASHCAQVCLKIVDGISRDHLAAGTRVPDGAATGTEKNEPYSLCSGVLHCPLYRSSTCNSCINMMPSGVE
ncbi:hypothetical protein J6590_052352 [Homalodisca vitripennis]|nr:hypothetical protein J6590_052352 [Homalodisca vitripennis]